MSKEDTKRVLGKLIKGTVQDEDKVLEVIINAITSKYTDPTLIRQAVNQAITNYENQLRVFMVAVANRQLTRILRLIRTLDSLEEQLESPSVIANMASKDLIRIYALQQSNLTTSLDYVKKVADMRMELATANAAITNSLTTSETEEINALMNLPKLSSFQRNNIRKIVEGLVSDIALDNESDSTSENASDIESMTEEELERYLLDETIDK